MAPSERVDDADEEQRLMVIEVLFLDARLDRTQGLYDRRQRGRSDLVYGDAMRVVGIKPLNKNCDDLDSSASSVDYPKGEQAFVHQARLVHLDESPPAVAI